MRSERLHAGLIFKQLFENNPLGTFTGQKNTKKDVQQRIDLFDGMLTQVLS